MLKNIVSKQYIYKKIYFLKRCFQRSVSKTLFQKDSL
jgi:hypothetical protein